MADGGSPKSKKMTESDLLTLIKAYELASLGSSVAAGATISSTVGPGSQALTTLEIDRFNALNTYYARPIGNEVENRSQIVLPELRDTVEWIMPQLMRMFAAAKTICRFDAISATDMDQAELETQVVNHIFMKENNGFFILHDYFKDALLLRNGYAKVYWCEEKKVEVERYSGLTEDEVSRVMETDGEDDEVEVLEQREYPMAEHPSVQDALGTSPPPLPQSGPLQQPAQGRQPPPPGMPMQGAGGQSPGLMAPQPPPMPMAPPPPVTLFDLKIRRTQKIGRVKVECVPPEEMRVSPRTRGNMEESPFAQQFVQKTRSDLVAEGHKRDVVDGLTTGRPNWFEMDALARNQVVDQLSTENPADHAMQEIEVRECVMRVDFDGDGIAELRCVTVAGNEVLENEEIEETEFTSCVPKRMPHRHTGISLYDELADLQVIKTTLFRQGLDNLYLANNTRVGADWQNVNIDDLLTSRPGGVVRTKGPPANSLMPFVTPSNMMEAVVPVCEYIDNMRTMRTGVGRDTMGLDMDALQDVTKGGQLASLSAAGLKQEMIARLLAEGVKDIFIKIQHDIIRHQEEPFDFEAAPGQWQKIDPTSWRPRSRISPNVGLGSGNREEARANVALLGNMQAQLVQFGLIKPPHAYATFKKGCEVLGFENPAEFALDPSSDEYKKDQASAPPPQPAPQVQAAQIRGQTVQMQEQAQTQRALLDAKVDLTKAQTQQVHEKTITDQQTAHETMQNQSDRQTDLAGLQSDQGIALMKIIGGIVAQQLKQNAEADAGAILKKDYQEVRGSV
jgi:hypothetical protein